MTHESFCLLLCFDEIAARCEGSCSTTGQDYSSCYFVVGLPWIFLSIRDARPADLLGV